MTAVIHALDTVGWTIYMSCDLSKQEADKVSHISLFICISPLINTFPNVTDSFIYVRFKSQDAIFFRHTGIARRRSYCSISFNKTDRVVCHVV